jgi:release factor glutamine methyltransferase
MPRIAQSKKLFAETVAKINLPEPVEEIQSVVYLIFEDVFQLTKTDILSDKPILLTPEHADQLNQILQRLNQHEPVQYILGRAFFCNRVYEVNKHVLIPRPETEELVKLLTKKILGVGSRILDIGTGSGCIAISLAKTLNQAAVYASDVSADALAVAANNAARLEAHVQFFQHDILHEPLTITNLDVIVSNPPYIKPSEKTQMNKNVTEYEPALALFASEEDPLIFYKAISAHGRSSLRKGGMAAVEINERLGKETADVFMMQGYQHVKIIQDVSGKDRFVTAIV